MFPPLLYLVLLFGLLLCFPLGIFPLPVLALKERLDFREQDTSKSLYLLINRAISQAAQSPAVAGGEGPCFAVCALVCDLSLRAECVPAFTRESKRGPFVGEVEKRLGDKIYGGSFAGFSPSADVEGSQRTGKCMYIKARRNQGLQMFTTDHAAQRGRDAFGTATRISASLFRRLSVFFESTPDQGPKAAKFAVLIPGPGIFVNVRNAPRVVIPPPSETPPVSACKPLCAILLAKASVYPLSGVKANVGRL